jgi:hypothetical protein
LASFDLRDWVAALIGRFECEAHLGREQAPAFQGFEEETTVVDSARSLLGS